MRRNLPLLILHAREQVIGRFRPLLNANGVTEQQWRIVRLLLETGPLEPRHIGDACHLSSPSLAGVLARMEQTGWVRRRRLAKDQRRLLVSLTAKSRALAARLAPQIEVVYAKIEEQLGIELTVSFYEALDQVIARLQPDYQDVPTQSAQERGRD